MKSLSYVPTWLAVASTLSVMAAGCTAPKSTVSDDPQAIAAIEKAGGKVGRNSDGVVVSVDFSQGNVKDFDYALLGKLPALARLELFGADVNDATIDKLNGLKLGELVLENTEITDAGAA